MNNLGTIGLTLLALVVQSLRTVSVLLTKLDPERMSSDDLNDLLAEIHTAHTEITVYKIRAAQALERNKKPQSKKQHGN